MILVDNVVDCSGSIADHRSCAEGPNKSYNQYGGHAFGNGTRDDEYDKQKHYNQVDRPSSVPGVVCELDVFQTADRCAYISDSGAKTTAPVAMPSKYVVTPKIPVFSETPNSCSSQHDMCISLFRLTLLTSIIPGIAEV